MTSADRHVVVVANRLPVQWDEQSGTWVTSPGGLVSALTPILRRTDGTWVGWSGVPELDPGPFDHNGIHQWPVSLSEPEYREFYVGFCNGTLWPLYHDAVRAPQFHRHWWGPYTEVNEKFASAAARVLKKDDVAWIQDYQLQLVPGMLRRAREVHRIGFYLHIPFPPPELFGRIPWRTEILHGLLGSDVLAFQSRQSRGNFALAARKYGGARGTAELLSWSDREIRLQVAPIGIDTEAIGRMAQSDSIRERSAEIRRELGDPSTVILGVDRLDYTKGIDHRMRALRTLFDRRPELVGDVVLVQVAVPSRQDVEAYQQIRRDIEGLVGRINGEYATGGRSPIHYLYRSLPMDELVAYYRAADIMLVTPLRDGMNLVAKEYVATRFNGTGVLILSEFTGAAEQLSQAVIVNPHAIDDLAETLLAAITVEPASARRRMKALRRSVSGHDVFWWADSCLTALDV